MIDRTISAENRLLEGHIARLAEILNGIRGSKNAHRTDKQMLFGMLVGHCWSHPESIARYLWRTHEPPLEGAE